MILQIFNRFRRAPLQAIAVILLAAVLCASLCGLHAANISAQLHYEQTCASVPVKLIVTNLSATRSDGLEAPSWVTKVFTSRIPKNSLKEYVKDVQIKAALKINTLTVGGEVYTDESLVGITDLEISGEMSQGSSITWMEGYGEDVFGSDELVCVLPEKLLTGNTVLGQDAHLHTVFNEPFFPYAEHDVTLTIVGTHKQNDTIVYCPYGVISDIYDYLGKPDEVDAIRATLIDNSLQEEVREIANNWFAVPNPTGEQTSWRYSFYFYYPFALDIDDDLLVSAERTLKISLLINELCAVLVFALSAGASFFVGFLMIRSRKREIALQRTLGTPAFSIFMLFTLEQVLCLAAGIGIGGGFFMFEPPERLAAFAAVYFTGLCLALGIFLSKNLMTTLKEDE